MLSFDRNRVASLANLDFLIGFDPFFCETD